MGKHTVSNLISTNLCKVALALVRLWIVETVLVLEEGPRHCMSRGCPAMLCPRIRGLGSNPPRGCGDCTEDLCLQAKPVSSLSNIRIIVQPNPGGLGGRGSLTSRWGGGATAGVTWTDALPPYGE